MNHFLPTPIYHLVLIVFLLFFYNDMNSQVYGEPVYHWDFASGIPAAWESGSDQEPASWEYRGPLATPDINTGARGSCAGGSVPLASTSRENGFVIFDSNYWDDDAGPCGNTGSGQAPGPHLAWLTTEALDFTGVDAAVLTFQQQYKHFISTTRVWISIDGGVSFELAFENPIGQSTQSGPMEWATSDISDWAAGQSDVRLKFEFNGLYYWWLIDDITIFTPHENDLIITNPRFVTTNDVENPAGFAELEYDVYSALSMPEFEFVASAVNVGSETQINAKMHVEILNEAEEVVYDAFTIQTNIASGATHNFNIPGSVIPPQEEGNYVVRFEILQYQTDETPENNIAFKDFGISANEFARDKGVLEDTFIPGPQFSGQSYEMGNFFELLADDIQLHSVGVVLSDSTYSGTIINANVYNMDRSVLLGSSEPYTVTATDLLWANQEKVIQLPLIDPIFTNADSLLVATVSWEFQESGRMAIGRSGEAEAETTLLIYPETNGLYYLLKIPMVRIYLYETDATPGCMSENALNYDPTADVDDGSCLLFGCTDPEACNYGPHARVDDGSCIYDVCNCFGDMDYNLSIGIGDLLILLTDMETSCSNCAADLTQDDQVNIQDLLMFLTVYGTTCAAE